MNYWMQHCERPRERPGLQWDVFVSYRSVERVWAIALYDMLTQCGYNVFLDQFVLVQGDPLASQLGKHLRASASGVLVWSKQTADSKWVEDEFNAMMTLRNDPGRAPPFHFVVASIDGELPPGLAIGQLYLNFADFPDGPMGADLVRLTAGLQGKPLSPPAVARIVEIERKIKEEPVTLRALARIGDYAQILEKVAKAEASEDAAYTTTPTLIGVAMDLLIRGEQYKLALQAAEIGAKRFSSSLRIQQLWGLALRRDGQLKAAELRMALLQEKGHRDPETLGIYAAALTDLSEQLSKQNDAKGARDKLELARNVYQEAFTRVPTDTYVGNNAASKSALLGDLDRAKKLAENVLVQLTERKGKGESASDYWTRATEAVMLLLLGEHEKALALFHEARIAFQHESGSIAATGKQVGRLLAVLDVPEPVKQQLKDEFGL